MTLTNVNTSSNEALSVRANVLAELRDSLKDLSPFTQAFLAVDVAGIGTASDVKDTFFMEIWNSIHEKGSVEGAIGVEDDGTVKTVRLTTAQYPDVNQGNEIVDVYRIDAAYNDASSVIGYQNDRYANADGVKGEYLQSTYYFQSPSFITNEEIDQYLEGFAQQIGSIDILLSLSNMAVAGNVSYSDVMSVIGSSSSFVNPKLQGIVSQYATYLTEDNACAIVNLMISDYFNEARGYKEEEEVLKFNSIEYDFDSSCILGWHQISGLITSAVAIVASIFSPIAGFISSAVGSVVNSVSEFMTNADQSVPKVVPEAAHNIAALPVWQASMPYNRLNWAHQFIARSGRLTLTTEFFKLFAWVSDENTLSMEMYVLTGYGYNVVSDWRRGMSGYEPVGTLFYLRNELNFDADSDSRSFQTLTFPNDKLNGAWRLPTLVGLQSIPDPTESSDKLYSRIFNGLFMCSLYVLYASNSSIHVVTDQTRANSIPSDYTIKEKLLWYVGAYLDSYAANFLESSMATWLVPGWFTVLRDFASALDASVMLNRFVDAYTDGAGVVPSIIRQDYGQSSGIRSFVASTITSKGSAMVIPPMSKYSIGQKLAVTAGIAAVITVSALVAARQFRSVQARHAQTQKMKVEAAYANYQSNPSSANWNMFQKEVRSYNRLTYFNGASRISADDWGTWTTSVSTQAAAAGDTALASLLGTEAMGETIADIVEQQIPGLEGDNVSIQSSIMQLRELIAGPIDPEPGPDLPLPDIDDPSFVQS